ncbi:MAG: hypothetical protein IPF92_27725 [Myxococcales bacterium]|jgi:hypothetical protein|nr:hypothetical protein [Myxococcales bacterium]MBL0196292.1 hypothetical protein [Myxococcales bacterium]HQY59788.1 hypothetical protein [Polyangiaceae bacterium]
MALSPRPARLFAWLVAGTTACGGGGGKAPGFNPREEGCAVQVSSDAPRVQSENIGTVSARCDLEVSAEDCLRTLKDEVCKAGGDRVWGVDKPTIADGKQRLSGRAARTTTAKKK